MKVSMKGARVNAGLKQTDVCKLMGICQNTIIDWEKERKYPDIMELRKFCEICGCKPEDITFIGESR